MQHEMNVVPAKSVSFDEADLEIRATLSDKSVVINVMKSGACVHRLTIDDAVGRMEHSWIADMFAREDRVELGVISREAEDYISDLNINQG